MLIFNIKPLRNVCCKSNRTLFTSEDNCFVTSRVRTCTLVGIRHSFIMHTFYQLKL